MTRTLAALALALASMTAALPAQAQGVMQVRDWAVYVDPPTRFAYVKTPQRWVFVRRLDEAQMQRLHPRTLTALLPPEPPEIHWAHPALQASPRVLALRQGPARVASRSAAATAQ